MKLILFAILLLLFCTTAFASKIALTDAKVIKYTKKIDVSRLDTRLDEQPFEAWLKKTLKPDAKIIWESNDCGERAGRKPDRDRVFPVCAGISAVSGAYTVDIAIAVGTEKQGLTGEPCVRWVACTRKGQNINYLKRLSDLPKCLGNTPDPVSKSKGKH